MLPAILRQLFSEARDDYLAKKINPARGKFERVLALTGDPAVADAQDLKDLKLLTTSYLDIIANATTPEPVPSSSLTRTSAPMPPPSVAAAATVPPTSAAASTPDPPVKTRSSTVEPAVTIRQTIPAYAPAPGLQGRALSGTIRVVIGIDGKVKSAKMEQSVEPLYDIRLTAAAKSWSYKPAMLDGKPIESEKVVSITVGGQ
jgi:hypothetical protein